MMYEMLLAGETVLRRNYLARMVFKAWLWKETKNSLKGGCKRISDVDKLDNDF